jgi:carbamoyl-phosphate synthase large subunit
MDLKILWTISNSMGTAADLKMLKKARGFNIDVITADRNDMDSVGSIMTGKKYVVPSGKDPSYLDEIMDICTSEKITTIIPQYGDELVPFSENVKLFEREGIRVLISQDTKGLKIANNKGRLYEFFRHCDFVPRYYCASDIDEVERAVYNLGYPDLPVCIKPVQGEGGKGVRILTGDKVDLFNEQGNMPRINWDILKLQLKEEKKLPELLVTEYLPGKEYSVDCICKDGVSYICIPRQRMETAMGLATVSLTEKNEELIEISKEIISKLGLSYNVNIQFKYSGDNIAKLIEVNPRVSGSLVANLGAGVNMLELSLKLAYDMPIDDVEVVWGKRMIRYFDQIYI